MTIPDLICLIDTDSGDPVTNLHVRVGQRVAVILLPAPVEFRTERALSFLGHHMQGLKWTMHLFSTRPLEC